MDVEAAARAWADGWAAAWPGRDTDAILALYGEDAVYRSHPFREPHLGRAGVRDYVEAAFASEEAIECRFGEPIAAGERASVEYWAVMVEDGRHVTLAGTAVLRFRPDGLCAEHRDYWSLDEGRH